jgi:hypothetical protein
MRAFDSNEIVQWYCFDLLGSMASNAIYDDIVLEDIVGSIVMTMMELHKNSPHLYEKSCQALVFLLAKKIEVRDVTARHVARISRNIVRCAHDPVDKASGKDFLHENLGDLVVCHDILDLVLSDEF